MKVINKILMTIAIVLVLSMPMFVSGCFGDQEGIKLHTEFKTQYYVGEALDLTNGKIEYTDDDGKKMFVAITNSMVTGFDNSTVGTREMIITYEENTILVSYTITMADVELNAVYYHEDAVLGSSGNDYVKFTNQNTMLVVVGDSADFTNAHQIVVTRSVVSGKVVYSGNIEEGVTATITVLDNNTLSFHIVIGDIPGNEATFTLTKMA